MRGRRRAKRAAGAAAGHPAPDRQEDLGARIDKLQAAADAASGHARNVYITFLLFGLYLAIIFGATTHEQLLRQSPVTLPLLNVGLPMFGFYWIAPALFVLLHLNLLLQLYLLSGKLHRFDRLLRRAVDRGVLDRERASERRAQLYPFPFSQMLVGRQHGRMMRFLLWLMVWLTVLVLPVVLLLMGQVRFLPYHDAWTTMWQRFMVAADVLLILIFWRAIRYPRDRLLWQPGRWIGHQAKVLALGLVALVLAFGVFTFPAGDGGDFGDPMADLLAGTWLARPSQAAFETIPFLQRNLVVREVNLVASWPTRGQIDQFGEDLAWQNFGAPPNLRGRDLRYADLVASILVRGDFRDANLEGARLFGANFQRADFRRASLRGASLGSATLRDANLMAANLEGANLTSVDLRGADLTGARLQGGILHGADLQGADLSEVNLQGAVTAGTDLGGANFRGADLALANLQGAYLWGADLRGANLSGTDLRGAYLDGADLQGADLARTHLWRASFGDSRWALADLTGADVGPIKDLNGWLAKETGGIVGASIRRDVEDRLRTALADNLRADTPHFPEAWRSGPSIVFEPGDPLPTSLGWGALPWATPDDYDRDLAIFLGDLACNENATFHVARRFAESAVEPDPFQQSVPLLTRLLVARLIGEDCPPAAELSKELLSQLRVLAIRTGQ